MKSIGIKLADGSFYPIIAEGSEETKTLEVTTVKDNQTTVQIDLYSSESGSMTDAQYVDSLEITHLNPHPNGEPSLHLEVSLDGNSKLRAKVLDPETGMYSSTGVSLVSRSEAERSNPANFSLGDTDAANSEDFDFDGISRKKEGIIQDMPEFSAPNPVEAQVSDEFVSDDQVFADDNMMADSPVTDEDLFIAPTFSEADEIQKDPDEIQDTDDIIVDNDGTKFSFDDETEQNKFQGITADDFVSIEGTTGENGFELPDDIDSIMPPDGPSQTESAIESLTEDEPEENRAFTLNADTFLSIDGSKHTGENGFEVPPELLSSDLYDDPQNPPAEEMPEEDEETYEPEESESPQEEETVQDTEAGTNYDLPDFDELVTDTSSLKTETEPEEAETDIQEEEPEQEETDIQEESETQTEAAFIPPLHQTNITEDLPDFGEVDLSTDDNEIDLPDFDDLPQDSRSTSDAIISELPDFESPWDDTPASSGRSSSMPDFELPDFDDSPALRDMDSFQTSSSSDDTGEFGDDFFEDSDTNYSKASEREKYEAREQKGKEKNRNYALICIICAILCLIIFGLLMFIFPTRLRGIKKDKESQIALSREQSTESITETVKNTETVTATESSAQNTAEQKSTGQDTAASGETATSQTSSAEKEITSSQGQASSQTSTASQSGSAPQSTGGTAQGGTSVAKESITGQEDTIIIATTPSAVVPSRPEKSGTAPADIRYQVVRGDTLWDISNAYYKNPWRYPRIAEYNSIKNPDFIRAGQILLIPAE